MERGRLITASRPVDVEAMDADYFEEIGLDAIRDHENALAQYTLERRRRLSDRVRGGGRGLDEEESIQRNRRRLRDGKAARHLRKPRTNRQFESASSNRVVH